MRTSGRAVVTRILIRLERAELRAIGKGARQEALNYHLAWLTVSNAFYGSNPDPFAAAELQIPIPCPQPETFHSNVIQMQQPIPPPAAPAVWVVDGRNGRQWTKSVIAYLEFRSGQAWRPSSHRFNPEYEIYARALYEMNSAFNSLEKPKPYKPHSAIALAKAA